ncbi:hypothetical protein N7517_011503 [Penicillium concentricum]|uniref:Uncharacterized protein n=1 Tax=Penicillium concentricum TaxID=293559 RepID=A0A9W9RCQ9_9EURO|nr:uncharacterized protein N7517_011503 [Penicillium concentricum]KAJ5356894.1 hypothetical protein N7517_011503 [Penicillium concentricum]
MCRINDCSIPMTSSQHVSHMMRRGCYHNDPRYRKAIRNLASIEGFAGCLKDGLNGFRLQDMGGPEASMAGMEPSVDVCLGSETSANWTWMMLGHERFGQITHLTRLELEQ